jgi:hypothetical protein
MLSDEIGPGLVFICLINLIMLLFMALVPGAVRINHVFFLFGKLIELSVVFKLFMVFM